jgi:hypothetical protein
MKRIFTRLRSTRSSSSPLAVRTCASGSVTGQPESRPVGIAPSRTVLGTQSKAWLVDEEQGAKRNVPKPRLSTPPTDVPMKTRLCASTSMERGYPGAGRGFGGLRCREFRLNHSHARTRWSVDSSTWYNPAVATSCSWEPWIMPLGIRPTVDFAFKKIFGSPQNTLALIGLLNAILDRDHPIEAVEILNPLCKCNDRNSPLANRHRRSPRTSAQLRRGGDH